MKFVLGATTAYWWPVILRLPDPDTAGSLIEQQCKVRLRPMDQDAFLAEQDRIAAIRSLRERGAAERAFLSALLEDWADVIAPDGAAVPFTPERLDEAMQRAWFRDGIWRALAESELGQAARLGN